MVFPLWISQIIFSLDILCHKSDFFSNVNSGTCWVTIQAASFLSITIPQFFFLLEAKQMENNDW